MSETLGSWLPILFQPLLHERRHNLFIAVSWTVKHLIIAYRNVKIDFGNKNSFHDLVSQQQFVVNVFTVIQITLEHSKLLVFQYSNHTTNNNIPNTQ